MLFHTHRACSINGWLSPVHSVGGSLGHATGIARGANGPFGRAGAIRVGAAARGAHLAPGEPSGG